MRFQNFIGPSYTLRSVNVDCQRSVNLYPEIDELRTAKEGEIGSLNGTPGLLLLATLGLGPIRCEFKASDGTFYVVSGATLYKLDSSWAATSVGTINSATGPVSMDDNGIVVFLVDGTDGWYSTLNSTTLTQVTDPAWQGSAKVVYQDGYFVFTKPRSNQFYVSGLLDVTFNALDFGSKETSPDAIVGHTTNLRNLYLFGEMTTEVWYDAGNPTGVPFSLIQGGYSEVGCCSPFSISKGASQVFFLGKDRSGEGIVYIMNGYQPQRISTHAVELAIQSYGDLSQTTSFCYQSDGHNFYQLNFKNANTSWVYDTSTGLWHERVYTNQGVFERHRAECHAFVNGIHVVGDYDNGNIYQLSNNQFTDNGVAITRQRISPHISKDMLRNFHMSFQLDIESGVGSDGTGQGVNPQAVLQFSDDGGHRYSNENWTGMGKIGQTKFRAIWNRLGVARDRVYKITSTDPVKQIWIGAEINIQPGTS